MKRQSNPLLNPFIATSPAMRMNNPRRKTAGSEDAVDVEVDEAQGRELTVPDAPALVKSRSDEIVDSLMMEIDESYEPTVEARGHSDLIALPGSPRWMYSGRLKTDETASKDKHDADSSPTLLSKAMTVSAGSLAVALLAISPFVGTLGAAVVSIVIALIAWTRPWAKISASVKKATAGRVIVSLAGLRSWLRAEAIALSPDDGDADWLEWDPLARSRDMLLYWRPASVQPDSKQTSLALHETAVFQVWAKIDGDHVMFSVDQRYIDLSRWLSEHKPATMQTVKGLSTAMVTSGLDPRVSSRGRQRHGVIEA